MAFSNVSPNALNFYEQALERLRITREDPRAVLPELTSGARAVVFVGGQVIECTNVSFQTAVQTEVLQTVDTHIPWEVIPGQIAVAASLAEFVDPRTSAEKRGLFATMASFPHQPMVELQVFDKTGAELFASRGYFVRTSVSTGVGGLSQRSMEFVGVGYAHNVAQTFRPYDGTGLKLLQGLRSGVRILNRFGV